MEFDSTSFPIKMIMNTDNIAKRLSLLEAKRSGLPSHAADFINWNSDSPHRRQKSIQSPRNRTITFRLNRALRSKVLCPFAPGTTELSAMDTECGNPRYIQKEFIRDDPPYLRHLLSGNEPPTEEMLLPLKSSACRVAAAIDERARLRAIDEEYKTVLSPLRRVLPEVLAKIFSAVHTPQYDSDAYYDVFAVHAGPWTLSRVCGTWRQVSHTLCADIWATMSISISDVLGRSKKDPFSLLRAALSFGGRCLLSLRVEDSLRGLPGWNAETFQVEISESLFKILISQSQRWQSVILSIHPRLFQLLPLIRGRIPELEAFNICLDSLAAQAGMDGDINGTFDALAIAPRLKHLAFEEWGLRLIPVIEASHLVTFFDDRSTDGVGTLHRIFLDIIRDAPSLESFGVNHQGSSEGTLPVTAPRIVHQALRNLTVSESAIICSLDLPNLTSATIQHDCSSWEPWSYTYPDVLPALLNLIKRSHCILTSLTIADTQLNEHIFSILSLCPNLAELELRFSRWRESDNSDPILQTLVDRMSETTTNDSHKLVLVPLLKDFTVSMRDHYRIRDDVAVGFVNSGFVRMLKVRLDCKSPLWSITITIDISNTFHLTFSLLDQEDIKQIKAWQDDRKLDITMDI
ncbi:uncharacterized protein ARMOST_05774 [Armillaria ostoyae]|uniref:F-box domain-containing protein n=1 Tax=Armillaria ostoyae TaxID=47428 RepID=A0A284R151_ARMOS|nr:uncharacterized protein ARMOST_05774 [Armillaria ostoyae]